jgi:hypothetical protein
MNWCLFYQKLPWRSDGYKKAKESPPVPARGDEFSAGAKQRVAPLTLRHPDNRIPGPPRNMIVGDVSKKSYFASTIGAVSEQPIAKYFNSQGTRD